MAAIADADVSIDTSGNIRWTGAATTNRHTVLEFIQWLMLKQDDGQASGDDILDITVETPFNRSTDQIVALNWPFNIDDTFATHLYDGSVEQALDANNALGERWSGLEVLGPYEAGSYMILQAGRVLPAFWGTGINAPGGGSLVFSRHLVKSYEGGVKIDGGKITVLARVLSDQYRRFPVTLGTANSTAAIGNGADIFNTTADTTIAGWTSIVNTEGFQELNIDATGAAGQEFYSQWDIGSQTINNTYERAKWITQDAHEADATAGPPTGADFVIENGTIVGQAQSFIPLTGGEHLTEARANIKILADAGALTGNVYAELWDSDDLGTPEPTGGALARSENIPVSAFTTTYEETIFRFNRKDPTGVITTQQTGLALDNAEYFIVFRHDEGDASNNLSLQGQSTSSDATQSQADDTGAVWTGSLTDDIYVQVKSSPEIHGITGETFEGISVEVPYSAEGAAPVAEDDIAFWGTRIATDTYSGTFIEGEHVRIFANAGTTVKNGGQLLYDDAAGVMVIALDNITGNLAVNDDIVGVTSGATVNLTGSIVDDTLAGGTGLVLAIDDNGTTGEVYLQLISGSNPVSGSRIFAPGQVANYVDATTTINTRTLIPEFIGTSTGSNIIGAYGIGFDPDDVGESDLFLSLDNTSRQPPNNQTFTVSGLVGTEDRVLVTPRTGTAIDRGQWTLATALSGAATTSIVITTGTESLSTGEIPPDVPKIGTTAASNVRLRVQQDDGIYRTVPYTTWDTVTFGCTAQDFSGGTSASTDNNVFVAFIDVLATTDTESYTATYVTTRPLFVRVRDGGGTPIKTFESNSANFKATAQTVAATRTPDA
jgi:hypothetical protein